MNILKTRKTTGIFILLLLIIVLNVNALETGPNYERECNGDMCNIKFYSTQKYWDDNGKWVEINEDWTTKGCKKSYEYCVVDNKKNYEVHVKDTLTDNKSILLINKDGEGLAYSLLELKDSYNLSIKVQQGGNIFMDGNRLIFSEIFPDSDFILTYLPSKLKKELIIKEELPFKINGNLSLVTEIDTDLSYNKNKRKDWENIPLFKNEQKIAEIHKPEIDLLNINDIFFDVEDNKIAIELEYNDDTTFPLIIDPTVQLGFGKILEDGHIIETKDGDAIPITYGYNKNTDSDLLRFGSGGCTNSKNKTVRAYMEWNISTIPDEAIITNINLMTFVNVVDDDDDSMNATMIKNTDQNVIALYQDIADPLYNYTHPISNLTAYNITFDEVAIQNFQGNLTTTDTFSFGIRSNEPPNATRPACPTEDQLTSSIRSSEYTGIYTRPRLEVTYELIANETEGEDAIEQGILNILPNASIHNEQQVYTVSYLDVHELGRFDKFAVFENQRWTFNYITSGENYTNMNNISTTFFVLEMTNMTPSQITAQVEDFINNTKN